jgi:hypothetical protein
MKMTKEQKEDQAREIARWAFMQWKPGKNRFYQYKGHYYLRSKDDGGWLIDFTKYDDIIEVIWDSGWLKHPCSSHKKVLVNKLLQLSRPVAIPINTMGLKESDFADLRLPEIERLESFVNACDERNMQLMKGTINEN